MGNENNWPIGDHLEDFNNPHMVTKEQVGLDKVDNVRQYSALNPPPNYINTVCGKGPDATGDIDLVKGDVNLGKVDNVKQYSVNNPPPYPVTSVNGMTGTVNLTMPDMSGIQTALNTHVGNLCNPHQVTKDQVGLGNVPNVLPYHSGNKPSKEDIGLSHVENTSDADKPVSTAMQAALNKKLNLTGGTVTGTTNFTGGLQMNGKNVPFMETGVWYPKNNTGFTYINIAHNTYARVGNIVNGSVEMTFNAKQGADIGWIGGLPYESVGHGVCNVALRQGKLAGDVSTLSGTVNSNGIWLLVNVNYPSSPAHGNAWTLDPVHLLTDPVTLIITFSYRINV